MPKPLVLSKTLVKSRTNDSHDGACDVGIVGKQKTELGKRLEELARYYNLALGSLAVVCGLERTHLQTIATSENCTIKTILPVSRRTGVDLNWLLGGVGELNRGTLRPITAKDVSYAIAARTKRKSRPMPSGKVRSSPTKE